MDDGVQSLPTFPVGFFTSTDMAIVKKSRASGARTLLLATTMPLTNTKHKHGHALAQFINGEI